MDYILHFSVLLAIYAILAISLNLLMGMTGIFSMAHAAMFGLGAYAAGLLSVHFHLSFFFTLPAAVIVGLLASALISGPALRVSGDYYIIAAFAMQIILYNIFVNWISFTGGSRGLVGIERPVLFGYSLDSTTAYFIFTLFFLALVILIALRFTYSPYGRVLKAIREDPVAVQALGKKVNSFKINISLIAAGMASLAGAIYAHYLMFINPDQFVLGQSILMASFVIVGGAGNVWGSVLGVILLSAFPEVMTFLDIPENIGAPVRQAMYGLLLILFMMFRPQGILGERASMVDSGNGNEKV
jgi:branched-chain amino acid transport system permease protein